MPEPRRIGTWISGGKYLDHAFETLIQHQFTAAQMWLTTPTQPWKITTLEDVDAVRARSYEVKLYVHAPYNTALFPPLVKHGKQMAWLRQFGRAVEAINGGIVLHFGHRQEYLDTDLAAARQMVDCVPDTVPIYIENAGGGSHWRFKEFLHVIEGLKHYRDNVWMCLDTAYAWSRGWGGFFAMPDETEWTHHERLSRLVRPFLGLLHLNNTYAIFRSGETTDHFPLFNGNIDTEGFTRILQDYPGVPVILERSNYMQSVVDRAAVIAIDANLTATLEALKKDPLSRTSLQ